MLLGSLTLRDYGLFRGEQTLELAPRKKYGKVRPIVVVGGHNGAGKTTTLEAIRLCLYGRMALGPRVKESDYKAFLRDRIHRIKGALIQPDSASVALEFEYSRGGERAQYRVERSWKVKGNGVDEAMSVLRDGKPLEDVDSEFWDDFVRSLVPPGLSQLFFFDGEKIQKLARDGSEAEALAEAIKALLGLDLVERLGSDLDVYVSRRMREEAKGSAQTRLHELEKDSASKGEQITVVTQFIAQQQTQIDYFSEQLARAEQRLAQRGLGLSERRGSVKDRLTEAESKLAATTESIRALFEGPMAIMACRGVAAELLQQLEKENELEFFEASQAQTKTAMASVKKALLVGSSAKRIGLQSRQAKLVAEELSRVEARLSTKPEGFASTSIIHGVSRGERESLARSVELAKEQPGLIAQLSLELVKWEKKCRDLNAVLKRAPDDDELAPLVAELSGLQGKRAEREVLQRQKQEELKALERELAQVHRERDRLLSQEAEANQLSTQLALAARVKGVLGVYLDRLTQAKVTELEIEVAQCFRLLCRKPDLVHSVRIDAQTFKTTLVDKSGAEMAKKDLSAGEKQIYAISLLWALAKVSGRALPMIVDTPLGRLDSHHRANLVSRYFPKAAHQVVILSTDTEIDQGLFRELQKDVSHAIHLVNHPEGYTEVREGYFWKEDNDAAA